MYRIQCCHKALPAPGQVQDSVEAGAVVASDALACSPQQRLKRPWGWEAPRVWEVQERHERCRRVACCGKSPAGPEQFNVGEPLFSLYTAHDPLGSGAPKIP